jgi:hypothetical protein
MALIVMPKQVLWSQSSLMSDHLKKALWVRASSTLGGLRSTRFLPLQKNERMWR